MSIAAPSSTSLRSLLAAVLLSSALQAQAEVRPGETFHFEEPAVVDGTCDGIPGTFCDFIGGSTPLRSYAYSVGPLLSAASSAFQYDDVEIAESEVVGGGTRNVIAAQISGTVSIRGFLYAMGTSSVSAGVNLLVLDVTDERDPRLVFNHAVADYALTSLLGGSISGSVNVGGEAGFPYAGASAEGGIGAEVGIEPCIEVVRDEIDFGFGALLQRGRVYRLKLELTTSASNRLFGGTAIASFFAPELGGPVMPNPFDSSPSPTTKGAENSWLSLLSGMAGAIPNLNITKGDADVDSGSFDVGGGDFQLASIWDQSLLDIVNPFGQLTSAEAAQKFTGHGLFNKLFADPPLTMTKLVTSSAFLKVENEGAFESLPGPGVELSGLTITLADDVVELSEAHTNQFIEDNLKRSRGIASLYLPAASGGQLERAFELVDRLIVESDAAGVSTHDARTPYDKGLASFNEGDYKDAYDRLCSAYRRLTRN